MVVYIVIFVISSVLALTQMDSRKKVSPYLFGTYMLALGIFVGVSDMLGGYDRYIYCDVFTSNANRIANGEDLHNVIYVTYLQKEPVYGLLNVLIGLFTPNRYIFILVYTLLLYAVYAICFYRYTDYPFFALVVFLGLMFFFTFTYLRQVLAAGVIWLALPNYKNRQTVRFTLMIAIAAMIHNSAIIMAVLYFIPLKKWHFERVVVVMLVLLGLGLVGVGGMFTYAGDITGNKNIAAHSNAAELGFRYEYVIESFLFLFILYKNYRTVRNDNETLSYLNLYLIFCGTLLLFCKSGDGGRIAWYGIMGIIIMLTKFCKGRRGIELRRYLVVLFFALFMRILLYWGVLLYPYKTFFTNGFRENDWVYQYYEYDHNYDKDKLYNL